MSPVTVAPSVAPPTVADLTAAPTTLAEPVTTVAAGPVDCAGFEALMGYERMMAVKNGTAPADPACQPVVERSRQALNTYETGLEFAGVYNATESDDLYELEYCDSGGTLLNPFAVPILYWGTTRVEQKDNVVSYQPLVTAVIPPGGSVPFSLPGVDGSDSTLSCSFSATAILAPAGEFAAGVDGAPAVEGDPLASDDPQVWGQAVVDQDTGVLDIGAYVNQVEDIHSADVGGHLSAIEAGDVGPSSSTSIHTICSSEPVVLGPDISGEYAWLVYASQGGSWEGHFLGLFSRGTDRRWRFVGRVVGIDSVIDPADPCSVPPRTNG